MTVMLFSLIEEHSLNLQHTATLLHTSIATIKLWKKNHAAPLWAYKLLLRKIDTVIEFPSIIRPNEFLAKLIKAHQLKHQTVAEIIGVKTTRVTKWLHSKNTPVWAVESVVLALLFEPYSASLSSSVSRLASAT